MAENQRPTDGGLVESKRTTYYSNEHKIKRYYSILREFMTFFHSHRLGVPYPADHEFTENELRSIEPQHIVNWLNMKMFGTLAPDFSGDSPISGSHHTIAFYRKGIGYFMPGGTDDWDPLEKTGNPTRSKAIRDLINKVRELNDDGVATPRKQHNTKKRSSKGGGGNLKRARKSAEGTSAGRPTAHPFAVTNEINGLLRQMHTQKGNFLRSLESMSAAVEMMKSEVEVSYGLMIEQVTNLGSRIAAAKPPDPAADAPTDEPPRTPRSHNLFTIWTVQNGRLTPLGKDWIFPINRSVIEALNLWLLGDHASHMPPLQFVTVGHMKHIKGAADSLNKVRKFMKIVKYLGLKAGYWCEHWDSQRIDSLWTKICPGIETHLGPMGIEDRNGHVSCKTMINSLSKNGELVQEMASNSHILTDEDVERYAVRSTEEASEIAMAGNDGGEETEAASSTPPPGQLELLWGIHHGKLNPLPADWEFPTQDTIMDALQLWFLGDPGRKIPPLQYIHSSYVTFLKSGTGYLSKLRCVMKVVKHIGNKLNCWHEDDWDKGKITTLWYTVWDDIEERIKFKQPQGRNGDVTWQSIYNRMHERGVIKEVNADQIKGADQDLPQEV